MPVFDAKQITKTRRAYRVLWQGRATGDLSWASRVSVSFSAPAGLSPRAYLAWLDLDARCKSTDASDDGVRWAEVETYSWAMQREICAGYARLLVAFARACAGSDVRIYVGMQIPHEIKHLHISASDAGL